MPTKPVDFPNVIDLLISYWKLLLVAIILGAIIGVSLAPKRPPIWTSGALVRLAQITGPAPLVDAATVTAIVQQPSFVSDALEKAGLPRDVYADPKSSLAQRTLVAIPQRSPNLLQLQVQGYAPEDAKRIIEGAVATLQQQTAEPFEDGIQERKRRLAELETQLANNVAERNAVIGALKSGQLPTNTHLPDTLVISYVLRGNEIESGRLHSMISALQDQLNPTRTFNTKLAAPVSVAPVAQGGGKLVSAAVGALFGLVLAFALALVQTMVRARRPLSTLINRG
ncbi:hypothetical protein D3C71_763200 [compost metagenome]